MGSLKNLSLTLDTVDLFVNSFKANGIETNSDYVKWLYINNDTSKCIVDIAYDFEKERVAGIYALACLRFKIFNKQVLGATSVDTLTDVNYRKQGLFYRLALDVYDKAYHDGVAIVHGFPNKNSVQGYRNKINYHMQDPIPFLIRPMRIPFGRLIPWLPNLSLSFASQKRTQAFFIEEGLFFPNEVDEIWDKFSQDIGISAVRDRSFLDWRFCKKPNGGYRIAHCYDSCKNYLGFIVFLIRKNSSGGYNSYIMELLFPPDLPQVGNALLDYAISEIAKENTDFIMCLCYKHSPNYNTFKSKLFFKIPRFLAPTGNHFGYKLIDRDLKDFIHRKRNWYLSYADSDTV